MISHNILLFGPLRERFETRMMSVEMPKGCSVNDVLNYINVDSSIVKTAVNGTIVDHATQLGEASEIALLPPVSGG